MRQNLPPRVLLDIELSAYCSRHRYTVDAAPVIEQLRALAGAHQDVLAEVAGSWAGYYGSAETRVLATALAAVPGAERWVAVGRERRGAAVHGTRGF